MAIEPTRINFSYRLGRFLFRIFLCVWFRLRVHHRERVPEEGAVIIGANHISYLDPIFICCALKRMVVGLARESVFHAPVLGSTLRSWNVIPVDQGGTGRGLKTFFTRLLGGDAVMIFPEGERSHTGQIISPQPGVGLIILKSTAPVVPVKVFGAYEAYGRHHLLPRPFHVEIKFGEPLDFADLRAEAKRTKDKARLKELYWQAATDLLHAIATLEPGTDKK
jgi:1-acyl-sn-glycerol-3-phosphate acyltransferase